jgi:hypothetical protein
MEAPETPEQARTPRKPPCERHYLINYGLVRYRTKPDKSLHQLKTAMHRLPQDQERAINLSILVVSGLGKFPRVESN